MLTLTDIFFFQTVPSPPETISLQTSDCCSASIRWPIPPNEREDQVSYTLQLTSSCAKLSNTIIAGIRERSYTFLGLCASTEYTVAIRVTELQTNTTGFYGRPFTFSTTAGTPSPPRYVTVSFTGQVGKIETMTVTWGVPEEPNGTIVQYEIHWSPSGPRSSCDQPDNIVQVFRDTVNAEVTEFKTNNVSNLNNQELKSLLVCVRARLSRVEGEWGFYQTVDVINVGGLTGGGGDSPTETCTNLIVVAVIACVAVLSSIILGVVLILVICYNGWAPCGERKEKRENDVENYAKSKPVRPPYNKSMSMQSTSSTAPMLGNGRNGSVSS